MPLLKSNQPAQQVKPKSITRRARAEFAEIEAQKVVMVKWPELRRSEGIGMSFRDGVNFGLGLAVGIGILFPILIAIIFCALTIFVPGLAGILSP